jgi:hypothetical protein
MPGLGDASVQGDDVAMVDVCNFAVGANVAKDVAQHDGVVMLRSMRLA